MAAIPKHFIVMVPGYMGSVLRSRKTGEAVWLNALDLLLRRRFNLSQALDAFFDQMRYPNDDLEPVGIVDQIVFAPPLFKQEQYGRLLDWLRRQGYAIDPTAGSRSAGLAAYTFPYDWRQDNRISARQLGYAIQGWQERHPGAQAWIIAHSNGGIVSRWYIEKEGGAEHVGRLFLMGSPWDGAPKSVQVMMQGLDHFLVRLFDLVYDIPEKTRDLIRSYPSFYQLIPSHFSFLRDEADQDVSPFTDLRWLDTERQRQMLLDGRRFNQELGNTLSVDTLCFFGVKQPTAVSGIVHIEPGGQWSQIDWDRSEAGDATLPMRSAVNPNAHEKLPYAVGHGDIYVNPAVLEKLEWEVAGKYKAGVLAKALTPEMAVEFLPDKDVYSPGERIFVWAEVTKPGGKLPVGKAAVQVRLEWAEALPGAESVAMAAAPGDLPEIALQKVRATRFEGELLAPQAPGYYRLLASVTAPDVKPVELEELILVENEPRVQDSFDENYWAKGLPGDDDVYRHWEPGDKPVDEPILKGLPDEPGWESGLPKDPLAGGYEAMSAADETDGSPAPSEAGKRFLNAEITEYDMDRPLPPGEEFTLAFYVDVKRGRISGNFQEGLLFQKGEKLECLDVHLVTSDFIAHTHSPQELRVPPSGASRNKARFDLEPKFTEGVGQVTALFYKENNFLQGMMLRLNVGQGAGAFAGKPETLGRALSGINLLEPRSVSLLIQNTGAGFDLTLVGAQAAHARLPITLDALDQAISEVRQALLDVVYLAAFHDNNGKISGVDVFPRDEDPTNDVLLAYQSGVKIPPQVGNEALKRLAVAGYSLYRQIFYDGPQASLDSKNLGDRLGKLARGKKTLNIQIVSQEFLLPWGLLYMAEELDPERFDADLFLGMRHIIEHIPLQQEMPVLDPDIPSREPDLAVSLNIDASLDEQFDLPPDQSLAGQVAYWQALKEQGKVALEIRRLGKELQDALKKTETRDQILYFLGHAVWNEGKPALIFAGRDALALKDLQMFAPGGKRLPGAPLVFLNACESAELSPRFYRGFMPYFVEKGARGVIGTECQVPVRFAAAWAQRFFVHFLAGEPLGEVMLNLRREFYQQENNLLGLMYALYCDGDTRVTPGL